MSAAPFVALRTDVRKEERVGYIADRCGYNAFEALGRLASLWCWCTDRDLEDAPADCPGYAVPDAVVRRFLGPAGVEAILGDGCDALAMGQRWGAGLVYLRGTADTVRRLRKLRGTAVAGGEAAVAVGRRGPGGKFVRATANDRGADRETVDPDREPDRATVHEPVGQPVDSPATASEIPDPTSQIPLPESDLPPARARAAPAGPDQAGALAQRQALRGELWRELGAARKRVSAELGEVYRPLLAQDPGERKLALMLADPHADLEQTATAVRHAITVAAAEAGAQRKLEWLTGTIFEERNFRRLAAGSVVAASRPRPAKPGEPARLPPRKADPPQPAPLSAEELAETAAELQRAKAQLFGAPALEVCR